MKKDKSELTAVKLGGFIVHPKDAIEEILGRVPIRDFPKPSKSSELIKPKEKIGIEDADGNTLLFPARVEIRKNGKTLILTSKVTGIVLSEVCRVKEIDYGMLFLLLIAEGAIGCLESSDHYVITHIDGVKCDEPLLGVPKEYCRGATP